MPKKSMAQYYPILIAALFPMLIGFIWYNPKVFGTVWQREAGISDEKMKSSKMSVIFIVSILCSLMLAFYVSGIATHDVYVGGATWYVEKNGGTPEEIEKVKEWQKTYKELVADNPKFTTSRWSHGFAHGVVVTGLFFILPLFITNGLFERKSWKYILINAGYWIVTIGLMSILIAAWK